MVIPIPMPSVHIAPSPSDYALRWRPALYFVSIILCICGLGKMLINRDVCGGALNIAFGLTGIHVVRDKNVDVGCLMSWGMCCAVCAFCGNIDLLHMIYCDDIVIKALWQPCHGGLGEGDDGQSSHSGHNGPLHAGEIASKEVHGKNSPTTNPHSAATVGAKMSAINPAIDTGKTTVNSHGNSSGIGNQHLRIRWELFILALCIILAPLCETVVAFITWKVLEDSANELINDSSEDSSGSSLNTNEEGERVNTVSAPRRSNYGTVANSAEPFRPFSGEGSRLTLQSDSENSV